MKGAGIGLIILGVLLMCGALLYQPTVVTEGGGLYGAPSEVYNIGALQYQELFFMGGVGSLIAGAVLYAVGRLIERLEQVGAMSPAKGIGMSPAPALEPNSAAAAELQDLDVGPGGCRWCGRHVSQLGRRPCSDLTHEDLSRNEPGVFDLTCRKAVNARLTAAAADASGPSIIPPGEERG